MGRFFSYAEQTAHYFTRPHVAPAREPVECAAAWRGDELRESPSVWRTRLSTEHVAELDAALLVARERGVSTVELAEADFPLPTLSGEIARWREEVHSGRGFLVVSGFPVDRWSQLDAELAFWCLGLHLGCPGGQNVQGDLLGHVADTGDDAEDPFVRLYRTKSDIAYHCDAADIVGLLCLRSANRGGASRIVSSVSVYDALLAMRPDLTDDLYEPFLLDIRNEDSSGALKHIPIPPCRFADGRLRTFYHSDYFRSVQRHDDVAEFTPERRELMDLYEGVASDPALYLDMELEPGDLQLLSNHTILHARTAYEDDPRSPRHLLRLWLSVSAESGAAAADL